MVSATSSCPSTTTKLAPFAVKSTSGSGKLVIDLQAFENGGRLVVLAARSARRRSGHTHQFDGRLSREGAVVASQAEHYRGGRTAAG